MCGIAGIVAEGMGRHQLMPQVERMLWQLEHRGPDGLGVYCDPPVVLGHARLAIIDLAGGAQPIHNEDRTVWVSFNGEIFNYLELRASLERSGHRFYTQTDTEVLVHLYEEKGDRFVEELNGQFAISLWDARQQRLLLVRDRVGITPLFYQHTGKNFCFASEIKAILALNERAPVLNPQALDQIMTFWSPLSPETLFRGISEVKPGEMVEYRSGKINQRRYWDWTFPTPGKFRQASESSLIEELGDLLNDSIRLRLRADVPVGAYLSGGLDSSLLVSMIHRYGNADLKTFSLAFQEPTLDESSFQSALVGKLGLQHHQVLCRNQDIAENFTRAIWQTELPILRTAPVPMLQLSELVRKQGYKVVLTGEGADEVFGGYDIFKEAKIRRFWSQQRNSSWRPLLFKRLYPYLELSQRQGRAYLESFFGVGLDEPNLPWFSHLPRWRTTALCKVFYSKEFASSLSNDPIAMLRDSLPDNIPQWHSFNQAQYVESKTLLASYLLSSQGDRMQMASGVECRFPYLDHRLIEFAAQLPPRLKMKVLREKYLLKELARGYLPAEIVNRHKQPYRAPDIAAFFNQGVASDYVNELLSPNTLKEYGYFDPAKVGRLLEKIRQGRVIGQKDNMAFVSVLSTQVWHQLFIKGLRLSLKTSSQLTLEDMSFT